MAQEKYPISQQFGVMEDEDRAIFPMRLMDGKAYVIIEKKYFTISETNTTFVLEQKEDNNN